MSESDAAGPSSSRVRQDADAEQEQPQRRLLALVSTAVILADGDERAPDEIPDTGIVDMGLHAPRLPSSLDTHAGYLARQLSAYSAAADRSGRLLFRVADPASYDGPAEDEIIYLRDTHAQRAYPDLGDEAQPRHSVGLITNTDVDPLRRGRCFDIHPLLTSTAVRMRNFCGEPAMAQDHATTAELGLRDLSYLVQQPGDFARPLPAYIVAADRSGRLLIRITDPGPAEDDAHRSTSAIPYSALGVEAQTYRSVALIADTIPLRRGYYLVDLCPRPPSSAHLGDNLCSETGVLARYGRLCCHAEASRLIRFVALPDDYDVLLVEPPPVNPRIRILEYEAPFGEVSAHESYAPVGLPHEESLVGLNVRGKRTISCQDGSVRDDHEMKLRSIMRSSPGELAMASSPAWLDSGTAAHDAPLDFIEELSDAEQAERFTGLFRELRGGPNHVAVEFCADIFAGLYKGTAAHGAVVGIPIEHEPAAAREAGVSDGEEECEVNQMDRLSDLPDHLIHDIVSRLPLVDIVRTSVLGRRWREVWTYTASLEFDDMATVAAGVTSFIDFVDGVLARCCHEIQQFVLTVTMPDNIDGPRLAAWAAQAADRVTGSVIIQLDLGEEFVQRRQTLFEMPNRALAQSMGICISDPEVIVFSLLEASGNFTKMTDLYLSGARFTDHGRSISAVIRRDCPVLTSLTLEDVRGVVELEVTSGSLKYLTIKFMVNLRKVEVRASSLKLLHLAYSFAAKQDTELSLFQHRLEEILWCDIWPLHSHFEQDVTLEELRVHRLGNYRNLERTVSHFRAVKRIYVLVSDEEDTEEVRAEIYSLKKPRRCELLIQVSKTDTEE